MTNCPGVLELERYLSGALHGAESDSIRTHVSTCAECASRLSDVQQNLDVVAAVRGAIECQSGSVTAAGMPSAIGPYEIVQEVGRGGMGVVYQARQREPSRSVAVKVLHPGYRAGDHHERLFRREVAALGRLRHPNVAAIYEAGRTPEGRSYLVMELVHGLPLTRFASERQLGRDVRLSLFQRACEAVAYAHQRGVIHRDLKPSNILVEESGAVKVLDFGLAAILASDESLGTVSVISEPGRVFGTIPYMSPEHVSGASGEIDARSDVYALGVVLYELLTWRLPYDVDPVNLPRAAGTICGQAPVPPGSIDPALRGDIETIVLKALAKEPHGRYQTVAALADDVRRYLNDEPILARPPSFSYQFRKLVRRHRVPFALATTVAILIVAFGVTAGMLAWRLHQERAVAVAARDSEAVQRAQAEAVSRFLQDTLASADPSNRPDRPGVLLREVLDDAAGRIADGSLASHPRVEVTLRTTIGDAYRAIGRFDEAGVHLERAVELGDATYPDGHPDVSLALNKLARLRQETGRYAEAEALFRRALTMRRRLYGDRHAEVAVILNNLGLVMDAMGRFAEAERLLREALALRRELLGGRHVEVANSLNNLATALHRQRRYAEAIPLYRESLAIDRALREPNHPNVAGTMSNLAVALQETGELDDAVVLSEESLAVYRRIYGNEHPTVALALNNLARAFQRKGDLEQAERLFRESLTMDRRLRGEDHPTVATTMANLANLLAARGALSEAEALHRKVLATRGKALGAHHPDTLVALYHVGGVLMERGENEAALQVLNDLTSRLEQATMPDPSYAAIFLTRYGRCLARLGQFQGAETALLRAHTILDDVVGPRHRRTLDVARALIECYEEWGDPQRASMWTLRANPDAAVTSESASR